MGGDTMGKNHVQLKALLKNLYHKGLAGIR